MEAEQVSNFKRIELVKLIRDTFFVFESEIGHRF